MSELSRRTENIARSVNGREKTAPGTSNDQEAKKARGWDSRFVPTTPPQPSGRGRATRKIPELAKRILMIATWLYVTKEERKRGQLEICSFVMRVSGPGSVFIHGTCHPRHRTHVFFPLPLRWWEVYGGAQALRQALNESFRGSRFLHPVAQ